MHAKLLMVYRPPGSLSIGFSRQEYWSGLPCHSPGNLPSQGTEPSSLMSPALAGRFFTTSAIWEAPFKPCAVLSHSDVSDSLQHHGLKATRLLCPWGLSREEYWSRLPCPPPEIQALDHLLTTWLHTKARHKNYKKKKTLKYCEIDFGNWKYNLESFFFLEFYFFL